MKFYFAFIFLLIQLTAEADSTWYHPNPWWKVARNKSQITDKSFSYRQVLPQFEYPIKWNGTSWGNTDWIKWSEHNNFSAPNNLSGHSWQVFISQNAEVLKKNPKYLAEIKGK